MQPLKPATVDSSEVDRVVAGYCSAWVEGKAVVRMSFPGPSQAEAFEQIRKTVSSLAATDTWRNETYQVQVRPLGRGWVHLSIKRTDKQPVHDWRDLQAIKNQLVGPECEGLEIYPAESRLVDSANQYHLWVNSNHEDRIPFGFDEGRLVDRAPVGIAGSVQRPI
ncbi:MAG: hypothetical protein NTU93_18680 [Arthrobacter sp.]|nr:hypothetical protein [Arthrobacter sp.]